LKLLYHKIQQNGAFVWSLTHSETPDYIAGFP
jgi:hypothetical protein